MAKPKKSEFEGSGPNRIGIFGLARAWEKLRVIYRTEQDADKGPDLNVRPDRWRHGGVPEQVKNKDRWWEIR